MKRTNKNDQVKINDFEVKIYTVPFSIGEINENISISFSSIKKPSPNKPSKEQIIKLAFQFHSQGNISEASKYYQYFINQGFKDYRVFSNYGSILKNLGNLKEAEISTRKAIELKPELPESYSNLGIILRDLGNLQEAEKSLRKAIELKPDLAEAYSNLANILKDLNKLKEAELFTRKAIELKPEIPESHSNLGSILRDLGNLQEAEISTRKAIELKPDFAKAHCNLGTIFMDLGNLQEAEISTRKAIDLKSDFVEAYSNLGPILIGLGNFEEAEKSQLKAIQLNPYSDSSHASLGMIYLQTGEYELSLKHFLECSNIIRGQENGESNKQSFITTSQAKIQHDIEQFHYLSSHFGETDKFKHLETLYKEVANEINWSSPTQLIFLSKKHRDLLKDSYNLLLHRVCAPKLKKEVINNCLNVEEITNNYFDHEYGCTYIDNLLIPEAIESLRNFLLGSTIWFDVKKDGYLGAYLKEGLANPLIIQIAEELRKKFPKIFKNHPINQIWAYKYDSRAKNNNSSLSGIGIHADFAAVNVNFWITPTSANLDPSSGGLVVYDVEAPKEWDFKTYNTDDKKINEELKKSKGGTNVVPYKYNRAVLFNSNLFHETDKYQFKDGYENRRINVTMLFGTRS